MARFLSRASTIVEANPRRAKSVLDGDGISSLNLRGLYKAAASPPQPQSFVSKINITTTVWMKPADGEEGDEIRWRELGRRNRLTGSQEQE
jgi:hypothetical protein